MSTPEVPAAGWFTSSFSQGGSSNCVEVNLARDAVYVRHSQHPSDAVIRYTHTGWDAFTSGVKGDEFNPASRWPG
ncbi:MAG: DUF397 domain-containing protein [Pseudonocardiaceae bacterium]